MTFSGTRSGNHGDVALGGVAVIGVPSSAGSAWEGTEHGPFFLRTISQQFTWGPSDPVVVSTSDRKPLDLDAVVDLGDVAVTDLNARGVADVLRECVAQLPAGVIPAVLGGDHSLTLGAVEALWDRYPDLRVVQFDHHLDVQTWGLEGERDDLFNTNVMSHIASAVGEGRCTQVGIGPFAAVDRAATRPVQEELARVGMQVPLAEAVPGRVLGNGVGYGRPLYLSVDVDVINPSEMSSTAYPAVAGLTMREVLTLIDSVLEHNQLVGFDVVEFAAPRQDRDPRTLGDAARASLLFMHLLSHALRASRNVD